MSKDITAIVFDYSDQIDNNRNINSIFNHLKGEVDELSDEIKLVENGDEAGPDGVVGEAVDIMLCAIDLIRRFNPNITADDVNQIAIKKCEKWAAKYKDTVY